MWPTQDFNLLNVYSIQKRTHGFADVNTIKVDADTRLHGDDIVLLTNTPNISLCRCAAARLSRYTVKLHVWGVLANISYEQDATSFQLFCAKCSYGEWRVLQGFLPATSSNNHLLKT